MRKLAPIMVALVVGLAGTALAGCGGDDDAADETTVELSAVADSGQSGTATLTASGESTVVTIEVDDPVSASQPAHVHEGTCDNLTPEPAYGLTNVVDGQSETTVDVSLEDLTSQDYAINLHMSGEDLATYTSCGDIE